jgi:hypothetical protein
MHRPKTRAIIKTLYWHCSSCVLSSPPYRSSRPSKLIEIPPTPFRFLRSLTRSRLLRYLRDQLSRSNLVCQRLVLGQILAPEAQAAYHTALVTAANPAVTIDAAVRDAGMDTTAGVGTTAAGAPGPPGPIPLARARVPGPGLGLASDRCPVPAHVRVLVCLIVAAPARVHVHVHIRGTGTGTMATTVRVIRHAGVAGWPAVASVVVVVVASRALGGEDIVRLGPDTDMRLASLILRENGAGGSLNTTTICATGGRLLGVLVAAAV